MSRPLIFLVDDDEDDRVFMAESFERTQAGELAFFSDGFSMLQKLETLPDYELPQVIVTDLNMPVMDGFELLQRLKKDVRYDSIAKIVFSTSRNPLNKERCLMAGATQYQIKPNSFAEFSSIMHKLLLQAHSAQRA